MTGALCNLVEGPYREGWDRLPLRGTRKRHYFCGALAACGDSFRSLCGNWVAGDPPLSNRGGSVAGRCHECQRRFAQHMIKKGQEDEEA